jgi:RNA polymerase sigma factor (sigma-70 family)
MQLTDNQEYDERELQILTLLANAGSFDRGFSLLVQTYQERLYWHIRGMLGQHDDADEVLQNTFIKVFKGFKNFQGNSKFYTWLYRIASNETITHLNKLKKIKTDTIEDNQAFFSNQHAEENIDSEHLQKLLEKAILMLPEKQRQIFLLRYYDEMPYQEIAEITGTSVGALKASYHIAAKKIETYILERKL